mmetsp:Transcript_109378/g.200449  ORF Transcript_109378/g.200449 Transcript_109378/m.200449 type:complete len:88 (+) Transcript_109378:546-809(+)
MILKTGSFEQLRETCLAHAPKNFWTCCGDCFCVARLDCFGVAHLMLDSLEGSESLTVSQPGSSIGPPGWTYCESTLPLKNDDWPAQA